MYVRSKYDFNNINKTNDTVLLRRERERRQRKILALNIICDGRTH